jgi:hypothetical protein
MKQTIIFIIGFLLLGCEKVSVRNMNNETSHEFLVEKGKVYKIGSDGNHYFVNYISTKYGKFKINTEEFAWNIGDLVKVEIYSKNEVYLGGLKGKEIIKFKE